jgi:hypothetical protein
MAVNPATAQDAASSRTPLQSRPLKAFQAEFDFSPEATYSLMLERHRDTIESTLSRLLSISTLDWIAPARSSLSPASALHAGPHRSRA